MDKSVRTIFGDAATATLIEGSDVDSILEFEFGTDGSGYDKLIIPASGEKRKEVFDITENQDESGNIRTEENIFMDGAEIFNFTIDVVPKCIENVLKNNKLSDKDIDLFVFHQANKFMLEYLRKIMSISNEKFVVDMEDTGNTVSSSIPLALKRAEKSGRINKGDRLMLIGFGVGLSWGAIVIDWNNVD